MCCASFKIGEKKLVRAIGGDIDGNQRVREDKQNSGHKLEICISYRRVIFVHGYFT